jgi:hypothetical protein
MLIARKGRKKRGTKSPSLRIYFCNYGLIERVIQVFSVSVPPNLA